jgi:tRNA nucleotidyltransferase (CCA-adding enzyme)
MNLFDRLSGSRLYDELLMTFNETEPVKAVKRLSEYGLLKVIHPALTFDERLESMLQATHDTLTWFNLLFFEEKPDRGTLYLMTLLSGLSDSDRETAFTRLSAPSKTREVINKGILNANEVIRVLPLHDPAKIYKSVCNLDIETILFAMAVATDNNKKKEISNYLLELRKVRPSLTGNDLRKIGLMPGPIYSEILNNVLDEKLKGRLKTKEDEVAFVMERYKKSA